MFLPGSLRQDGAITAGNAAVWQADRVLEDGGPILPAQSTVEVETDSVALDTDQSSHTIVVTSANEKTVSLPSVGASDVGVWFHVVRGGAGKLNIDAADNDTIADSGVGDTIYSDSAGEAGWANITLMLVTSTMWVVVGGHGTWTTTD